MKEIKDKLIASGRLVVGAKYQDSTLSAKQRNNPKYHQIFVADNPLCPDLFGIFCNGDAGIYNYSYEYVDKHFERIDEVNDALLQG